MPRRRWCAEALKRGHQVDFALVCGRLAGRGGLQPSLKSGDIAHADGAVAAFGKLRKTVAAIGKEQARVRVTLTDGKAHEQFVEHACGSSGRPLSDAELETKFRGLADGVLSLPQIETALQICRDLETTSDAGDLARAAAG